LEAQSLPSEVDSGSASPSLYVVPDPELGNLSEELDRSDELYAVPAGFASEEELTRSLEKVDVSRPLDSRTSAADALMIAAKDIPLLSKDEVVRLSQNYERGDLDSKNLIISSNLRLVGFVSKRVDPNPDWDEANDLIMDGMDGLIRAAEKFDWRKGYSFATYAYNWINQSMVRGQSRRHPRLNQRNRMELRNIHAAQAHLVTELQREPSKQEIAEWMGTLSGYRNPITPERVGTLLEARLISLNAVATDNHEEGSEFIDCLADEDAEFEDDADERVDNHDLIESGFKCLSDEERKVLTLSFGLDGEAPMNQVDIGKRLEPPRQNQYVSDRLHSGLEKLREHAIRARYIDPSSLAG
jgi:RNA polymerase primary sigma factor